MRFLKVFIIVVVVAALGACAKLPQAEIDAAKTAVAAAAQLGDIVTYAGDTLKSAQDKLAQMETEVGARNYDLAKRLALEAKTVVETAANDAAKGKKKAQADATALVDSLKEAVPAAEKKVGAAKKIKGLKLDLQGFEKQLSDAKVVVADAAKDLSDESYVSALQKASKAQAQLTDIEQQITKAEQRASNKAF
jgi:acylphosphatase